MTGGIKSLKGLDLNCPDFSLFLRRPKFGSCKKIFFQVNKKKIFFYPLLCKAGIACILDAAASTDKLTTYVVKLSVAINDDLHHH